MEQKLHHFVLQPDGVIGWIEKYGCKLHGNPTCEMCPDWNLQSAISNAKPVVNQEEVEKRICDAVRAMVKNHPYPLQCHVEKKSMKYKGSNNGNYMVGVKQFALVTFPSSAGVEETQEDNVSLQWLKDERNILSNTAMFMPPTDLIEKTKRVAQALDITIQYIEETRKNK